MQQMPLFTFNEHDQAITPLTLKLKVLIASLNKMYGEGTFFFASHLLTDCTSGGTAVKQLSKDSVVKKNVKKGGTNSF